MRWPQRLRGIDGLRGIAALSVATAHTCVLLMVGEVPTLAPFTPFFGLMLHGVTLFFVLSGFLLYRPFALSVLHDTRAPRVGAFYRNRLLRIFPAYLVAFVLAAVVLGAVVVEASPTGTPTTPDNVGRMSDPILFALNLALLQGYVPMGVLSGLNVSWSLVPELAFYAVLPGLWLLARGVGRRTRAVWAAAAPALLMVGVGTACRLWIRAATATSPEGVDAAAASATWVGVIANSLLRQADLFGWGMLAAVVVGVANSPAAPLSRTRLFRRLAAVLLVLAVCAVPLARLFSFDAPALGIGVAAALVLLQTSGTARLLTLTTTLLESTPLERAGVISYSIYLWHLPIILFLREHGVGYASLPGLVGCVGLVLTTTWLVAEISYRYVEKPALDRKRPTVGESEPAGSTPDHA